jgi:hypothetical protein
VRVAVSGHGIESSRFALVDFEEPVVIVGMGLVLTEELDQQMVVAYVEKV